MEQIFKLQPDRCLALRGFDTFAASAALHSATPVGFQVSGTFRDPADFAVLMLWDADNFFEHPSTKYLPDFNFAGLVLTFDVEYSDGVQPLDSPKFNWIDWATLDCVLANGNTAQVRLWDYATLASGTFTPASGTFDLSAGAKGPQPGEQLTLWFENMAFDYTVPAVTPSAEFTFFAAGTGTIHSITVASRVYSHTESNPAGESSADQASALIALINAGAGDPDVAAHTGSATNAVSLTVSSPADATIPVSATDGNAATTLGSVTLDTIAASLAASINSSAWWSSGGGQAVIANSTHSSLVIQAARYGYANSSGATVTWSNGPAQLNSQGATVYPWSEKFPGLAAGDPLWLNQTEYMIASADSPTQVTLTTVPKVDSQNAQYLSPRGGRDGNMFTLYSIAQPATGATASNLNTTQPVLALSGGTSAVTWKITVDFTACAVDQLRQCWLTFAPALTNGATYPATNWLATFSNWTVTGDTSVTLLKVAGPGSVRVEEYSTGCTFQGPGWSAPPGETGAYSKYAAMAANNATAQLGSNGKQLTDSGGNALWSPVSNSVTVTYQSSAVHNLYVGTALYTDRGTVSVVLDSASQADLHCYLNTGSEVVTRRLLAALVPAGPHTVTLTLQSNTSTTAPPQYFYFDFLEAAILSDFQPLTRIFQHISPALDYDTDHTYKLSPTRLMWIFDQLGFAGPVNEYLGVFWWNQRSATGVMFPQTTVTFSGTFVYSDSIFLTFDGSSTIGRTVFAADTNDTIAAHFAYYINASSTVAWASVSGSVITVTSRSPAAAYQLSLAASTTLQAGSSGVAATGAAPATGVLQTWVLDPTIQPVLNQSVADWHADFYSECFKRNLDVTTAGSMELVLPPSGFAALFPDSAQTPLETATGFGSLTSTQCAIGAAAVIAYQKRFYQAIAQLQTAAGLTPAIQYGEFLWWYFNVPNSSNPAGMAYYDAETTAAALTQLGRSLHVFLTQNDDPTVNNSADATFLRNRLRDHVGALAADMKANYPNSKVEVLFPYDVNYPQPITPGNVLGGRLNYFVNLPVEWKQQPSSGLDRIKVEALQFATQFRNLDLSTQAVSLMPGFGWPRNLVRYLVPVFGTFVPWATEAGLAFSQNLNAVNLWAFDHICLLNLDISNLREP